jgi:alkanesulfonate monooxygenase SsuD/methylene tetrahydromethanopterin reductase-like flavin-dependent oxidoreductase (luciferase family)
MKVGVLQFFSWSRRVPLTAVYERAFARIELMDQTGYDCVWLAEHHFNTYSVGGFNRSTQHSLCERIVEPHRAPRPVFASRGSFAAWC